MSKPNYSHTLRCFVLSGNVVGQSPIFDRPKDRPKSSEFADSAHKGRPDSWFCSCDFLAASSWCNYGYPLVI